MIMALTVDYLRSVGELVSAASSLREAAATWRAYDPGMRVVVVDASDMRDETPALLRGDRRVYLASSNGHCWHVTQQPEQATALILTQD
jgi:uncharacterized protein YbjT (DUF2867 family)